MIIVPQKYKIFNIFVQYSKVAITFIPKLSRLIQHWESTPWELSSDVGSYCELLLRSDLRDLNLGLAFRLAWMEHRVADIVHSNTWNNNWFMLWCSWISKDLLIAVCCQRHSNRELWFQSGWLGFRCLVLVRRIAHVLLPTLVDIQISDVMPKTTSL